MPAILAKILFWLGRSPIGQALFTLIMEKLFGFLKDSIERERERRRLIKDAKESVQPLINAKTEKEVDAAVPSALDDF
jgi:anion-transporting  ArsA/GET3 family ATPase